MDMNKKTWYWIIGIIAALLVIFLFWGMFRDNPGETQIIPSETPAASQTESSTSAESNQTDSANSDYTRYMEEETAIMDRMMRDMELTEETGNSALDFIAGMIPHHEAAVSMAESYLNHGGSHQQLKPLAEDIISAQKTEITQMKNMQKEIADSGRTNQQQADAYRKEYQKMMAAHHEDHSTMDHSTMDHSAMNHSASIDTSFAEGMIMHHQMAVDMAKAILGNTDEQELLELAQQIVDTQETEIAQMQDVLNQQ